MIYSNSEIKNLYLACISTARPDNVQNLESRTKLNFTYYVKKGESDAYYKAGAKKVVEY